MSLDDESNWEVVHNGFYSAAGENPIEKILIPGSFTNHTIRAYTTSLQAKPTWWLAGRLTQLLGSSTSGPDFEASRWAVPLKRQTLIKLPVFTAEYRIKFEPVRWLKEIALVIEIYTGN
ncbi:hypothetical protein D0A34_09595 [Microcoleus vaginatus PCC 9802]|uniref:hypothetical protein n=1 Tax=Microcoleus vaginatus TaxID=119532 RepID=UPI00020D1AEF|nr:hypothetical protein MicvaDRAFT_4826 [Microcoleus vaginatus FGP-2]UNU19089.1 hypothetical protein D0A34_09595 [Microcoleus vaginatus PCC 9802]